MPSPTPPPHHTHPCRPDTALGLPGFWCKSQRKIENYFIFQLNTHENLWSIIILVKISLLGTFETVNEITSKSWILKQMIPDWHVFYHATNVWSNTWHVAPAPGRVLRQWGAPYLQANLVRLIGLQRIDIFRRNVGPFFLTKLIFFFIFSVKGIEPVNRFLSVCMPFSFWTLGEM